MIKSIIELAKSDMHYSFEVSGCEDKSEENFDRGFVRKISKLHIINFRNQTTIKL
jgi:hypothetical protein